MKPSIPLGQLMAAGFYGTTVPPDFVHLVRTYGVGNVILFRRNISDYDQLSALCRDLNRLILEETGHMPIIMSGEEGGTVSRIGSISAPTPCPMAVGATGDPENAFAIGRIIGEELRACGIHMALAPVLDCNCNPDNPVIGNRSFGADPQVVAAFGTAWINWSHQKSPLPAPAPVNSGAVPGAEVAFSVKAGIMEDVIPLEGGWPHEAVAPTRSGHADGSVCPLSRRPGRG